MLARDTEWANSHPSRAIRLHLTQEQKAVVNMKSGRSATAPIAVTPTLTTNARKPSLRTPCPVTKSRNKLIIIFKSLGEGICGYDCNAHASQPCRAGATHIFNRGHEMKFTKEKTQEPTIKRKYEKPVLIELSCTVASQYKRPNGYEKSIWFSYGPS
jgi:hypothetical protein